MRPRRTSRPSRALETEVIRRAAGLCEYCHFPESASELPFHLDHIIPAKHGGPATADNLAWACFSCNLCKGPNLSGIDPEGGKLTRLFHPRTDAWDQHFTWEGVWLRGKTAVGRTTIAVLNINHPDSIAVREALLQERAELRRRGPG
jgi:hypothetical protein